MKKFFKKTTAFALAGIMAFGLVPFQAFANVQSLVSSLYLTDISPTDKKTYNLGVLWDRAKDSPLIDTAADPPYDSDPHRVEGYDIFYRNGTKSEAYPKTPNGTSKNNAAEDSDKYAYNFSDTGFLDNSIYELKVVPYHMHNYTTTVDGKTTTSSRRAPYDPTGYEMRGLYLTDITVRDAQGSGTEMTVTWENPTFDGREIFDGYRIYAVPDDGKGTLIPKTTRSEEVLMSNPNLVRTADGFLKYTFNDQTLKVGIDYAVMVEPIVRNSSGIYDLVRKKGTIILGGVTYALSYTAREYRLNKVGIKAAVYLLEEGSDALRIYWDSLKTYSGVITSIDIYRSDPSNPTAGDKIGTIGGASAKELNFWLTTRPSSPTCYYIAITVNNEARISKIATYDPAYQDFSPYKANVLEISQGTNKQWTMFWEAFMRKPYSKPEENGSIKDANDNLVYIDRDITYEYWITDQVANFDDPLFIKSKVGTVVASNVNDTSFSIDPYGSTYAYSQIVNRYYTKTDNLYKALSLQENKIYYVKIVATRSSGQFSPPSYGSFYYPPAKDLATSPLMMSKPPLKVEEVQQDSILIKWSKKWFEIYNEHDAPLGNPTQPEGWYSRLGVGGVDEDGNKIIVYGDEAQSLSVQVNMSSPDIVEPGELVGFNRVALQLGVAQDDIDMTPRRLINIDDPLYEIHVVEYNYVANESSPEAYAKDLNVSTTKWHTIVPTGKDVRYPEYRVKEQHMPTPGPIKKNTSYIVFFRPYEMNPDKITAWYPSYVIDTTLDEKPPVDITPTVPILETVDTTDRSIRVRWAMSPSLDYEMAYGELISDYPSKGKAITTADIAKSATSAVDPTNGRTYYYYSVDHLFANTNYYVWIRSTVKDSPTKATSAWSNPIYATTKDIETPSAPRGLGLASKDNVAAYNKETNQNLLPMFSDYMIIEWMRDQKDVAASMDIEGGGKTDSADLIGDVEVINASTQVNSYMAKYNKLVANRLYYIRAKTILTMLKEGDQITVEYAYRVQVSEKDDFLDVTEVCIPQLKPVPANSTEIRRKESPWSETSIHFRTQPWPGEYDGDVEERTFPVPASDIEITYDSSLDALNYRFRSNGVGVDGTKDMGVDQRFISQLINAKAYQYEVDLTGYNSQPVKVRSVEIPYSIVKTLEDRKIGFKIKADNMTVIIPPSSFRTSETNALKDFGIQNSSVKLTLNQEPKNAPKLADKEEYASVPHGLTVQVNTPTRVIRLANVAKEMEIDLKLANRYTTLEKNVETYMADSNSEGWEPIKGHIDAFKGTISLSTKKIGSYAAIAKPLPTSTTGTNSDSAYSVLTKINIKDLKTYNPSQNINASQFNNLVAAIARNKSSVSLNENMSDADFQSLGKSKILVTGTEVARDAGVNALVRLYELKTKSSVKNFGTLAASPYKDISKAKPEFQTAMLKAAKLGFFEGQTANPAGKLSMDDTFKLLEIIVEDSGM